MWFARQHSFSPELNIFQTSDQWQGYSWQMAYAPSNVHVWAWDYCIFHGTGNWDFISGTIGVFRCSPHRHLSTIKCFINGTSQSKYCTCLFHDPHKYEWDRQITLVLCATGTTSMVKHSEYIEYLNCLKYVSNLFYSLRRRRLEGTSMICIILSSI